ncbi:MAG: recombinase family protein, partial [Planctomycetaceae bacterium]|nr:recombinase family protein [Planctomycetaceae bacterium]
EAWVHWAGGNKTYTRFQRPIAATKNLSNAASLMERVKELLDARVPVPKIAEQLNEEGFKTSRGKSFNENRVRGMMNREGLYSKRNKKTDQSKLKENEWTIVGLSKETGVGYGKIHRWIQAKQLDARKNDEGRWIVTADEVKRDELRAVRLGGRRPLKYEYEQLKRQRESES